MGVITLICSGQIVLYKLIEQTVFMTFLNWNIIIIIIIIYLE